MVHDPASETRREAKGQSLDQDAARPGWCGSGVGKTAKYAVGGTPQEQQTRRERRVGVLTRTAGAKAPARTANLNRGKAVQGIG
jgi:hypothetical protein